MAKSSKEQQTKDERKILVELQKNCKENIDTIAKHCGFSRQKVQIAIKKLEESHKILGYSAIVDSEKQDLEKFILFIKRTQTAHDPKDINEIVTNLLVPIKKDLGINMISSYRIHGEYDWVMIFTANDIVQAKKFSESIMQKFLGRQSIHISQILFTVRENCIQNPNIMEMKDFI